MFFFIAGIQPKTRDLDAPPRMCPACGLYRGRLKRVDHYVSLFFLPLFPLKRGTPFVECQSCGSLSRESGEPLFGGPAPGCPHCGRPLEKGFRYCPACGQQVG